MITLNIRRHRFEWDTLKMYAKHFKTWKHPRKRSGARWGETWSASVTHSIESVLCGRKLSQHKIFSFFVNFSINSENRLMSRRNEKSTSLNYRSFSREELNSWRELCKFVKIPVVKSSPLIQNGETTYNIEQCLFWHVHPEIFRILETILVRARCSFTKDSS